MQNLSFSGIKLRKMIDLEAIAFYIDRTIEKLQEIEFKKPKTYKRRHASSSKHQSVVVDKFTDFEKLATETIPSRRLR
jgi:hypothetical protein